MLGTNLHLAFKRETTARRLVDGCLAILLLCLLIALLPVLLIRGPSAIELPVVSAAVKRTVSNPESALKTLVSDDEEDACHPAPLDPDPSDDASGMPLHLETHVRKDSQFLPIPSTTPFFIPFPTDGPDLSFAVMACRADTPALPYFQAYPVFLICDLPPPTV